MNSWRNCKTSKPQCKYARVPGRSGAVGGGSRRGSRGCRAPCSRRWPRRRPSSASRRRCTRLLPAPAAPLIPSWLRPPPFPQPARRRGQADGSRRQKEGCRRRLKQTRKGKIKGLFGWLAGQPLTITVHVNSDFSQNSLFSHSNQLEQYFGLFFSPAEQALKKRGRRSVEVSKQGGGKGQREATGPKICSGLASP